MPTVSLWTRMLVDISEGLRPDPISRISVGLGQDLRPLPNKVGWISVFIGGVAANCYLINQTLRGRMRGVRAYCSLYPLNSTAKCLRAYSRSFGGN